jgi:hypothetical protein
LGTAFAIGSGSSSDAAAAGTVNMTTSVIKKADTARIRSAVDIGCTLLGLVCIDLAREVEPFRETNSSAIAGVGKASL